MEANTKVWVQLGYYQNDRNERTSLRVVDSRSGKIVLDAELSPSQVRTLISGGNMTADTWVNTNEDQTLTKSCKTTIVQVPRETAFGRDDKEKVERLAKRMLRDHKKIAGGGTVEARARNTNSGWEIVISTYEEVAA